MKQIGNVAEPNYFGRDTQKDYFFYVVDVPPLSTVIPNQSTPLVIDNDADFFWIASTYQADIAAAALTEDTNVLPLVNLELQDTGSGRNFMNAPVRLTNIAGDGKRPYRLIRPRRFGANTTIGMKWTNKVAAGTEYRIQFVFHGYKIYKTDPVAV
jgi:hypothetical protein